MHNEVAGLPARDSKNRFIHISTRRRQAETHHTPGSWIALSADESLLVKWISQSGERWRADSQFRGDFSGRSIAISNRVEHPQLVQRQGVILQARMQEPQQAWKDPHDLGGGPVGTGCHLGPLINTLKISRNVALSRGRMEIPTHPSALTNRRLRTNVHPMVGGITIASVLTRGYSEFLGLGHETHVGDPELGIGDACTRDVAGLEAVLRDESGRERVGSARQEERLLAFEQPPEPLPQRCDGPVPWERGRSNFMRTQREGRREGPTQTRRAAGMT